MSQMNGTFWALKNAGVSSRLAAVKKYGVLAPASAIHQRLDELNPEVESQLPYGGSMNWGNQS